MSESRTVLYRVRMFSWGVWIKLTAQSRDQRDDALEWFSVDRLVHVAVSDQVDAKIGSLGVEQLAAGFGLALKRSGSPTEVPSIFVEKVEYADTDFQPEGLTAAAYEWIKAEFRLELPEIPVRFSREMNWYFFQFN